MEPEPFYTWLTEIVEEIEPLPFAGNVALVNSFISVGSSCDKRKFIPDVSLMLVVGFSLMHLLYG